MDDAAASKMSLELLVISNVVTMRKDHERYTTQLLQTPHQCSRESGRIDQDVSLRTQNKIRRCSVRIGRSEPTKVNILLDQFRIGRRGRPDIHFAACSNRSCRAGD